MFDFIFSYRRIFPLYSNCWTETWINVILINVCIQIMHAHFYTQYTLDTGIWNDFILNEIFGIHKTPTIPWRTIVRKMEIQISQCRNEISFENISYYILMTIFYKNFSIFLSHIANLHKKNIKNVKLLCQA